jgi:hypothetical protein
MTGNLFHNISEYRFVYHEKKGEKKNVGFIFIKYFFFFLIFIFIYFFFIPKASFGTIINCDKRVVILNNSISHVNIDGGVGCFSVGEDLEMSFSVMENVHCVGHMGVV